MSARSRSLAALLGISGAVLAACGGPTRVSTLNQTTTISGAHAKAILAQQLAKVGHPGATVTCAKAIIVNVGPAASCTVTGPGSNGTVQFTFKTLDGVINLSSVKVVR
jgi:hypothetical protein